MRVVIRTKNDSEAEIAVFSVGSHFIRVYSMEKHAESREEYHTFRALGIEEGEAATREKR